MPNKSLTDIKSLLKLKFPSIQFRVCKSIMGNCLIVYTMNPEICIAKTYSSQNNKQDMYNALWESINHLPQSKIISITEDYYQSNWKQIPNKSATANIEPKKESKYKMVDWDPHETLNPTTHPDICGYCSINKSCNGTDECKGFASINKTENNNKKNEICNINWKNACCKIPSEKIDPKSTTNKIKENLYIQINQILFTNFPKSNIQILYTQSTNSLNINIDKTFHLITIINPSEVVALSTLLTYLLNDSAINAARQFFPDDVDYIKSKNSIYLSDEPIYSILNKTSISKKDFNFIKSNFNITFKNKTKIDKNPKLKDVDFNIRFPNTLTYEQLINYAQVNINKHFPYAKSKPTIYHQDNALNIFIDNTKIYYVYMPNKYDAIKQALKLAIYNPFILTHKYEINFDYKYTQNNKHAINNKIYNAYASSSQKTIQNINPPKDHIPMTQLSFKFMK